MPQESPQETLALYKVPPDEEIRERAMNSAAEKSADYYERVYQSFQRGIEDFWGETKFGWKPRHRRALYEANKPWNLLAGITLRDFLDHFEDPEWLSSYATELLYEHSRREPVNEVDPETLQEAPEHAIWRATVQRIGGGLVWPQDVLEFYWAMLWQAKPLECLKMLREYSAMMRGEVSDDDGLQPDSRNGAAGRNGNSTY